MQIGRHFEEHVVGEKIQTWGRTITEADVLNFVTLTAFVEPLFFDQEYVRRESIFKGRIVPGILVFAYAEGLAAQTGILHGTGLAFMGVDKLFVRAPTVVGDTLRAEIEVVETNPGRRPDGGRVRYRHLVKNQRDETVMEYEVTRLIKKKTAVERQG
jgi:acyl dehydratase